MAVPRVRPDLADLPAYKPGRPVDPTANAGLPSYKCSSNETHEAPLPDVVDVIGRAAAQVNRYPDLAALELTAAVAEAIDVPPEHLVFGPGSVGVLQQLAAAVASPGDEVVYAWRSFEAYPIITRVTGARPVPVPLTADGRHDMPALARAVTDRTRLLLVCSPNNPTGPVATAVELDRLLDDVPDDLLVVVDEAYVEFVRDPDAADGLAAYRTHPNVAVLRTFSKAYGLAGLRVGFAVAAEPTATALRATSIPFGVSSLAQVAALESLRHRDELLARVDDIVAERERVSAALRDLGWAVPASEGNFVWLGVGENTAALADAFADQGVAVRAFPGEGVRATIAEPEANDILLRVVGGFEAPTR